MGCLLGVCLITGVLFLPYIPYSISLKEGDTAFNTVSSPRFLVFQTNVDQAKTKELRDKRVSLTQDIYTVNEDINKTIKSHIISFFTDLASILCFLL